jgi:hypothetical protein
MNTSHLILSIFERMLMNNINFCSFKRFVYGREAKFKKTSLAVQVFRFAHKMQIDPLLKEVEKFLLQRLSAAVAFAAYDLFKFFNIKAGLSECKNKVKKILCLNFELCANKNKKIMQYSKFDFLPCGLFHIIAIRMLC